VGGQRAEPGGPVLRLELAGPRRQGSAGGVVLGKAFATDLQAEVLGTGLLGGGAVLGQEVGQDQARPVVVGAGLGLFQQGQQAWAERWLGGRLEGHGWASGARSGTNP
jgi:hypothetical protein